MDYASLRQEGIRQLERLTGTQWTDFNAHDPGITILEQLCYVLTDLSYRTGYDIPDLLAEGDGKPYANLHPPEAILTSRPVTLDDLRRLVLDVEGVKNAWIELVEQSAPALYYHPVPKELSLQATPTPAQPIALLGLYRVLIEPTDAGLGSVAANVARRLHHNRGLCEDFDADGIRVLTPQPIWVAVEVEIGVVDSTAAVRLDIEQRIADAISPPVVFASLDELLRAGVPMDEIFDGPRLDHGFLTADALQRATRRTAVNTSDLIHAIMDAAGVRAVRKIRIANGVPKTDSPDPLWSLAVGPTSVPRLDRASLKITMTRDGKSVPVDPPPASLAVAPPTAAKGANQVAQPPGRSRNVSQYWSVQNHLPALYGVGELGLPASAPAARRAQARQLQAYLMFFDQLMANYLAQLAHVKDLFAYDGDENHTYFTQPLDQLGLEFEKLRVASGPQTTLTKLESSDPQLLRKNRFLNHLLARFAETLDEHGAIGAPALLTKNKQAFLRHYPRLSGGRGTGFNYLLPAGPLNRSGLEGRLRLKLGLDESLKETFFLVEHILLRPMEGDDKQQIPLMSAALCADPYSLQLTFVFPCGVGRFPKDNDDYSDFRAVVEQTIREETPAHLTPYTTWMGKADYEAFTKTHPEWLQRRREYVAAKLGINLQDLGS